MGWWKLCDEQYSGDTPADIMGEALAKISQAYLETLGRFPTEFELEWVFQFSLGGRKIEGMLQEEKEKCE